MRLYNIVITLYGFIIRLVSPFNPKAGKLAKAYKTWREDLIKYVKPGEKYIWLHCSSLGEFEDGQTVWNTLKKQHPDYKYILTFFSSTGYEAKKDSDAADIVSYLPLDTCKNVNHFLDLVKPSLAVFSRNDIWPNYLKELSQREIPAVLISFQFSSRSHFLRVPLRKFYGRVFKCFNLIFVVNNETAEKASVILGLQNVVVGGNPRVDRIYNRCREKREYPKVKQFVGNEVCFIGGSALMKDTVLIVDAVNELSHLPIKWIIVPHEIEQTKYLYAKDKLGEKVIAYSDIDKLSDKHTVLWVDKIGILPDLYKYAQIAFIGGGFSRIGIHNVIEPAVYGCNITFGPIHREYAEAIDLMKLGGAKVISNEPEMRQWISDCFNDIDKRKKIGDINKQYVQSGLGSTDFIINRLQHSDLIG